MLTNMISEAQFEIISDDSKKTIGSDGSDEKMKMDLSSISFLKPHIINQKVYELAQKGGKPDKMPEVIKARENQKRYNNLRASRNIYNKISTTERSFDDKNTTFNSSNLPLNYTVRTSQNFSTIPNNPRETFTTTKNLSSTIYSRKLANLESFNRR